MKSPNAAVASLAVAIVIAVSPSARAEEFANKIPDRVWVDIGGTFNEVSTNVSVSGSSGLGATIDFEEVFDLPTDDTTFAVQGTVRVSEKRRWVDFGYVNILRAGGRTLQEDVEFGDYVYQAGGVVNAHFDTQFIYGAFRYDFLHEEKIRISGSAGASWMNLGVGLDGQASLNGGPVSGYQAEANIGAPVPMLGLNFDWAIAKGLVVRSYNRFFRLNLSDIDGGLFQTGLHLNWYFIRNLGIGLGFDRTQLKVNEYTTDEGDVGKFNYTVSGVGLYATMAF